MSLIEEARSLILKLARGLTDDEIQQAEARIRLAKLRGEQRPDWGFTPTSDAAGLTADEVTRLWIQHHSLGITDYRLRSQRREFAFAPSLARTAADSATEPHKQQIILLGMTQNRRLRTISETISYLETDLIDANESEITQALDRMDRHMKQHLR